MKYVFLLVGVLSLSLFPLPTSPVVVSIAMWFRCTLSSNIKLPIRTCCTFMAANGFKLASSSSQYALAYLNSNFTSSDDDYDDELQSSIAAAYTSTAHCFSSHNIHHTPSDLDASRVVETLRRLRTEPKIAFSFFHQVKSAGFQHNASTYAALAAVLCSHGFDRMLESLFLDFISPLKEHHCPLPPFQITELVEELKEELEDGQSMVRAYDALVKSCVSVAMSDSDHSSRVVELLRSLGAQPKLALSFFHDVRRAGFQHNVATCAVIVAILHSHGLNRMLDSLFLVLTSPSKEHYCSLLPFKQIPLLMEKLKEELVGQLLVGAYDALVKFFASVSMFDEAIGVMFSTERSGFVPHIKTCNFLLNCLIEHGKMDMALKIYYHLKRNGFSANDYTYAIVIKALCKKTDFQEAISVLLEMEDAMVKPNAFAYTEIIRGLCVANDSESGYKLLQFWIMENKPVDMYAYTTVIRGFCNENKFDEAENVFLDMKKRDVVPDMHTYGALINGYCKFYNLEKALTLHDDMLSKGIKTNCVIISAILQCLCRMGMLSEVVNEFNKLKGMGIYFDEKSYNIVLSALSKLGKVEQAVELVEEMKGKKMKLDIKHYTTLMHGYCLKGNMVCALNIMDYMEAVGIKPDSVVHKIIIESLFRGGKVEEAELFFNNLEVKSEVSCFAMISGYCDANDTRKAYELLVSLAKQGILASEDSYFKLHSKLCMTMQTKDIYRALKLFRTMLDFNVEPSKIFYDELITSLCQTRDLKRAHLVFDELIKRGLTPDVINYTMLINSYCKENHFQEAYALFQDMKRKGIQPDIVTCTVLLDGYFKTNARENIEATVVDTIFREIEEKKIIKDAVFYTVYIDCHCKTEKGKHITFPNENALAFLDQMIQTGVEPDTVTFTAILAGSFLRRRGCVKRVLSLFNEIIENEKEKDAETIL